MARHLKILLVEDDVLDAELIMHELSSTIDATVERVDTEVDMRRALSTTSHDVILSDFSIPGFDGFSSMAIAREQVPDTPFIVVSGAIGEEAAVRILREGANDYVMKTSLNRLIPAMDHSLAMADERKRRVKAMEALKRVRRRTGLILESAAEGIIGINEEDTIIFINPAALKMLGLPIEEVIGIPWHGLWPGDEGIHNTWRRSGKGWNGTGEIIRGDGSQFPAEFSCNPINENGRITGAVMVFRDISERLSTEKRLNESIRKLQKNLGDIINALSLAIESRDPYTAGHQKGVSRLAEAIGRRMNLPGMMIEGIRLAALVHDVGKIQVPAEILAKPGKLSDAEYQLVQNHPLVGFEILKDIDFPWPIARIVRQHHEKVDGTGYPDGIAGNDILREARVIAVADAIEAMISHRPYRAARGLDHALADVAACKGKAYDAEVVDACRDLLLEGDFHM